MCIRDRVYTDHGIEKTFEGVGNGPIDAIQRGMEDALGIQIKVMDYNCLLYTSFMDDKGIFLVKGAIDKVAACMGLSKVTIYGYLDTVRGKNGKSQS